MTERMPNIGEASWHNILGANDGSGGFLRVGHTDTGQNEPQSITPVSTDNVRGVTLCSFGASQIGGWVNAGSAAGTIPTAERTILNAGYWLPCPLFDPNDLLQGPFFAAPYYYVPNKDWLVPFVAYESFSFDGIGTYVGGAEAAKTVRMALYRGDRQGQPGALISETGAVSIAATGLTTSSVTQVDCNPGYYVAALNTNATLNTAYPSLQPCLNPLGWFFAGDFGLVGRMIVTRAYAAFPDPHPGWAAADVDAQTPNMESGFSSCPILLHLV